MKIVQINATCGIGSTGKICLGIYEVLAKENIENYILYSSRSNGHPCGIACSDDGYIRRQALKTRLLGNYGFNSIRATQKIIQTLEKLCPDIVHLHNIHGHDCHLEMLFAYFKEKQTKLVWTFHDCWAFTGYCTYFDMVQCNKWQSQCAQCPQRSAYSWFFDRSKELFEKKKELFSGLDLTIVTPSQWLADRVKESFFKDYPIQVIYNGIDLEVFKPTPSDFREKYSLENKKILLGVSFEWDKRKGIDVFVQLAKRLPDTYQIVLVGTDPKVEQLLPDNVIAIRRTQNQQELAQIYTAADLFVNPTREEVLGLVNVEALACGTPGVTFKSGGSPECYDSQSGCVVACDDVDALEQEIIHICKDNPYTEKQCIRKAQEFDKKDKYKEYLELYERINATRAERH